MASSKKKRVLEEHEDELENEQEELEENENDDSDDDDTDESENEFMDQEIQVEFEAKSPDDSDFHGIKNLLQQLFLKANINLSDLTDTIISQNYVGSVLKQAEVEEEDDDSSMEDDGGQTVLGLLTAINMTDKKDKECVKQLTSVLTTRCGQAAPQIAGSLTELLHQQDQQVGFIINERFINIPPQVAVPSFQSLRKDLEKACHKKMNYAFSHFVMLCKTYRMKDQSVDSRLFYSNPEEQFFAEASDMQATWSVSAERDGVADGRWDEDDMEATRTLLVFSADKLQAVMATMEKQLAP